MKPPQIKAIRQTLPMIYAYLTPEIQRHDGWSKIGYTEQDVEKRLKEQTHTADVEYVLDWKANALFDDGSGESFKDKQFHAYLRKMGIENDPKNEWFHVAGKEAKALFNEFRESRGVLTKIGSVIPYTLRDEQEEAVQMTLGYYKAHTPPKDAKNNNGHGDFLWNAKPRFGKTLAVYDLCKRMGAASILILTNRPAIANSWYSDYAQFMGVESGYYFISETDALKGKKLVLSRKGYVDQVTYNREHNVPMKGCIEFVSLQDLKGAKYFGGDRPKLEEIYNNKWHIVILDESHEGVDTIKSDFALSQIKRDFTLYLSGTPFKALANAKFQQDAIFNWTYVDEQNKKQHWEEQPPFFTNPYAELPRLNLFTYQMSEMMRDKAEEGIIIDGDKRKFFFSLNDFFETSDGKFVHDAEVDKFLDMLTTSKKYPFSTEELRNELKHTLWLLNRIDSAKALERKLNNHPVFSQYKIVPAFGNSKMGDDDGSKKSYDMVRKAIDNYDKTITLSVGQLTTGVTIPEWTAVLMLSSIESPALYMQAAFRAQNPCLFKKNGSYFRKENAYVFDFDPARSLEIFENFANGLLSDTAGGGGDAGTRKRHIHDLLNFLPVIGEDDEGEMIPLDAEKVMTIPRKIRAKEVVRCGFMSNFLFQNISMIFHAPASVQAIIDGIQTAERPGKKENAAKEKYENLPETDDTGEPIIDQSFIENKQAELFGNKVFGHSTEQAMEDLIDTATNEADTKLNTFVKTTEPLVSSIVDEVTETIGRGINGRVKNGIKETIKRTVATAAAEAHRNLQTDIEQIETSRIDAISECQSEKEKEEVNQKYDESVAQAKENAKKKIDEAIQEATKDAQRKAIETAEKTKAKEQLKTVEDNIKDHLRGFAKTIPSFLMAYGTDETTLATFDKIVPNAVFKEVTSISLDVFVKLRDGGYFKNQETGEDEYFSGHIFDEVVFNDSIKEFLNLKRDLKDYFNENQMNDIFDYIPPQKTNQIFTPKVIVKKMVDMLEEENPGCFDNPKNTFIDLYMKSGLFITEIVKRLYQSEHMKEQFPDPKERLQHIFEKQVYGLAPTEIIYRIALAYILGFDETSDITKHNFKQVDALPYAKNGTLQQKLNELYGQTQTSEQVVEGD